MSSEEVSHSMLKAMVANRRRALGLTLLAITLASFLISTLMLQPMGVAVSQESIMVYSMLSGSDSSAPVNANATMQNNGASHATSARRTTAANIVSAAKLKPIPPNSDYAYAFLVGGCGPEHPGYRGFLWSTMVSAEIFRANNSTADVVIFIQMAGSTDALPHNEMLVLHKMNIRVKYLPKVTLNHTFYDAVMEKFRILELVEYKRVMFLDADIMPLDTSFDYLFTSPTLKPNILRATRAEPSNAGFFVLEPGPGKFEHLQEIIDRREIDAIHRKLDRSFDKDLGWGVSLAATGGWKGTHKTGNNWNYWYCAADQGLLYHWAKFVEQNVTLIIGDTFENWGPSNATSEGIPMPALEESFPAPFDDFRGVSMQPNWSEGGCYVKHAKKGKESAFCHEPVRSLVHFYGKKKPWTRHPPRDFRTVQKDSISIFFLYLDRVNNKYGLGIDIDDWDNEKERIKGLPLGSSNDATFWGDLGRRIERRKPFLAERARSLNLTLVL